MKLVWLSDPHLEFLSFDKPLRFVKSIAATRPDAVLITGDLSTARRLESHLSMFGQKVLGPVYFLAGNHDFYNGTIAGVEAVVAKVCREFPNVIELGKGEIITLNATTSMIGHRGWADGRAGLAGESTIRLNDHHLIGDFAGMESPELFSCLNELGDQSAEYIRELAPQALKDVTNLVVATHVPPFEEAARYEGRPSASDYAPHFINVALGIAVREIAQAHPTKNISVLCGHTHHRAVYQPLPNLVVTVAGAEYGSPTIAQTFDFEAAVAYAPLTRGRGRTRVVRGCASVTGRLRPHLAKLARRLLGFVR